MTDEPTRILTAVTGAVTATIGVGTLLRWWSPEVGGGLTAAAAGWIVAAGEILRARVTPNTNVALTVDQAAELDAAPTAFDCHKAGPHQCPVFDGRVVTHWDVT